MFPKTSWLTLSRCFKLQYVIPLFPVFPKTCWVTPTISPFLSYYTLYIHSFLNFPRLASPSLSYVIYVLMCVPRYSDAFPLSVFKLPYVIHSSIFHVPEDLLTNPLSLSPPAGRRQPRAGLAAEQQLPAALRLPGERVWRAALHRAAGEWTWWVSLPRVAFSLTLSWAAALPGVLRRYTWHLYCCSSVIRYSFFFLAFIFLLVQSSWVILACSRVKKTNLAFSSSYFLFFF